MMHDNTLPLAHEILTDRNIAIKLVGVGGAGSNAVDRLKMENLERLQLAVINTDQQALNSSPVQDKILIGSTVTRGLSAGGDPELGREAAESDREKISALLKGTNLVFLFAGMGGGTGSGAAPIIAEIAAEMGALVIAFVNLPFSFEGGKRRKHAEDALIELRRSCDAVIPLPNDLLLQEGTDQTSVLDSFSRADEWMGRGVKSIWSMLFRTGLINLDFATLRQAFHTRGGKTLFGLGSGEGEQSSANALADLKVCPLLHTPEFSRKADRLLVNIIGGPDLTLVRVHELMTAITEEFGREAHVVMGAVIDETMHNRVEVCVIGTSDLGGRTAQPRRTGIATPVRQRAQMPRTIESVASGTSPSSGESSTPPAAKGSSNVPVAQDEFTFNEGENRGQFDKTDRNLFEGQDLDVPTYLRRGIKIVL